MPTASENIPIIARPWVSDNAKKTLDIVEKFVNEECLPADPVYASQLGEGAERWGGHPSVIDALKEKAKKLGLWNMFLAKGHYKEGAGFSNLEYGLIAEQLGKSSTASEVYITAALELSGVDINMFDRPPTVLRPIQEIWK
jgi:acyl-CoA dehydrogenase